MTGLAVWRTDLPGRDACRTHIRISTVALVWLVVCSLSCHSPGPTLPVNTLSLEGPTLVLRGEIAQNGGSFLTAIGQVFALDSTILITQPAEKHIKMFSWTGNYLGAVGGEGGGPGEFRSITQVSISGDTVFVLDGLLNRVTTLHGGVVVATSTVRLPPAPLPYAGLYPIGRLRGEAFLAHVGFPAAALEQRRISEAPMLLVTSDKHAITLGIVDVGMWQIAVRYAGRPYYHAQPVVDSDIWAASPDGERVVAVGRRAPDGRKAAMYEVVWFTRAGDTMYERRYEFTPRALTRAERDSLLEVPTRVFVEAGVPRRVADAAVREQAYVPTYWPPIRTIAMGQDGYLWLMTSQRDSVGDVWDRIDVTSGKRWSVSLPKRGHVRGGKADVVFVVMPDSLDVPILLRYHVNHLGRR